MRCNDSIESSSNHARKVKLYVLSITDFVSRPHKCNIHLNALCSTHDIFFLDDQSSIPLFSPLPSAPTTPIDSVGDQEVSGEYLRIPETFHNVCMLGAHWFTGSPTFQHAFLLHAAHIIAFSDEEHMDATFPEVDVATRDSKYFKAMQCLLRHQTFSNAYQDQTEQHERSIS